MECKGSIHDRKQTKNVKYLKMSFARNVQSLLKGKLYKAAEGLLKKGKQNICIMERELLSQTKTMLLEELSLVVPTNFFFLT